MDAKTQDIELLYDAVKKPSDREIAKKLHRFMTEEGFKYKINPKGKVAYSCKSKKEFLIFRTQIKIRLLNIGRYQERLGQCTRRVRDGILGAPECHDCGNHCKSQIRFEYDGVQYVKCHPEHWWINFTFTDIREEDVDSLIQLMKCELPYYLNAK